MTKPAIASPNEMQFLRKGRFETSSIDEQVEILSNTVPGLKPAQAKALIEAAKKSDVDLILGGSRIRNYFGAGRIKPDSDLDIGFSRKLKDKHITRVLDEFDGAGSLKAERGIKIFPGNKPPSGPIASAEEFFQSFGRRFDNTDFVPSGYIRVNTDGSLVYSPPRDFLIYE